MISLPDLHQVPNKVKLRNIWKFNKETPSVLLDWGLLPSVLAIWSSQLCLQVACHVQIAHRCLFFFKCNLPGVKDCKVLITTSVGSWYFGETCTTQHYIYTLIRHLYRIHTQISVFEKYHSTKADLYAKQSNRHGVMITSQTFWACTHGLSDRGEQSTMGSDSCIYQHI